MEIELYSLLSTIIVFVTVATVVFAFFSYMAFRVRQRASLNRPPAPPKHAETPKALPEPEFFKPYAPNRLQ